MGAAGTLGTAFQHLCDARGIRHSPVNRAQLDICDSDAVRSTLDSLSPAAVVNAAGYVRVDEAESDARSCYRSNLVGPVTLARECAERRIPFMTFSTDLVFDGSKRSPYVERDKPAPLNVYGGSKARAEREVLIANPESLVVRTSAFFGPWDRWNFATTSLRRMAEGTSVVLPSSGTVSPTYLPDLVNAALDLLMDGECGVWHLANTGAVSWHEFAAMIAGRAGLADDFLNAAIETASDAGATYPAYSVLGTEKAVVMPSLENALDRYFDEAPTSNPVTASV
jgi:dTDP-4-dehydrorhamnose reductase